MWDGGEKLSQSKRLPGKKSQAGKRICSLLHIQHVVGLNDSLCVCVFFFCSIPSTQ